MTTHKLTLVPYLQSWDAATRALKVRVLITPATGSPLDPFATSPAGIPAFADASIALRAQVSDAFEALPLRTNVTQTFDGARVGAPDSRAIFEAFKSELAIPDGGGGNTFADQAPDGSRQLRKYLPKSYRAAFEYVRPRTSLAVVDDSYHCLMKCPPKDTTPEPPSEIGWGEVIAFSLRRPRLAEALGLIQTIELTVDPAPRLEEGGWLWFDLAPTSDFASLASSPGVVRSFATRVPALQDDTSRQLFTPVVFPVSKDAAEAATLGSVDRVFAEATRFDDGFSKIVHARQPLGVDMLDEDGDSPSAMRDEGVQLAWDDEDVLEGQNRALGAAPDGQDNVVAPRGVLGYRVDARPVSAGGSEAPWTSLSFVEAPLDLGVDLGAEIEERWLEVHPTEVDGQLWLPPWFAIWRGNSIVAETVDERKLMNVPVEPTDPAETDTPAELGSLELRYGERYEFRVRMADATGGGPELDAEPVRDGESPIAALRMKRHVRPRSVEVKKDGPATDGAVPALRVRRPKLGYPTAVFAAGDAAQTELLARIASNEADPANALPPAIADVDAVWLQVRVLVRHPAFDPAGDREGWAEWYTTTRPFPADPNADLEIPIDWRSEADYDDLDVSAQLGAEGTVTGALPLVRARDLRLEVRALGQPDLSYFASDDARIGDVTPIDLHATEVSEVDPSAPLSGPERLRSILLRDDPAGERAPVRATVAQNDGVAPLVERLAVAADLVANDSVLLAGEGERVTFGCAGFAHHLSPDGGSVEVTHPDELAGQWVNVLQVVLARDWSWRGQAEPTLHVKRRIELQGAATTASAWEEVGTAQMTNSINAQARRGPQRDFSRILFLDAFTPPLGPDGLPYEVKVEYECTLNFANGDKHVEHVESLLPVATPPRQVPKVVSAGIALTDYVAGEEYESTESRTKRLWIEFEEPLEDTRDAIFARVLHSTPDPMLLPDWEPLQDPEMLHPLPIDEEWTRTITPGQAQDLSGLVAMQRLEPASGSDRHFLVPLPPNTDAASPELFSFFTYEFRVGHDAGPPDDPFWSTAQARFGDPLRLEGVQHPAPELTCAVVPGEGKSLRAESAFATPYAGLVQATPSRPNTQIWFVLYARLLQADASSWRNVQIDLQPSGVVRDRETRAMAPRAATEWTDKEVRAALARAGIPEDAPLTVLAVEVLPEPNGSFTDPLGGDLGQVRVLRTSPLRSLERDCCAGV